MKGESKAPIYFKFIYLILIISGVLSLFLPYRIIVYQVYVGPSLIPSIYQNFSGLHFKLTYGAIFLMILTAVFAVFSRKKSGMILSLIFLGFYMLYVLFLYFVLNFILSIGNPPPKADAGFGYYLLVIISILFTIITIIVFRITNYSVSKKTYYNDLLDNH